MATATASTATTGCVKWFNNKAGYGFITVTDNGESRDIFVHHTAIQVGQSQYKYLVQGEYVELTITPTESDKHTIQVSAVHGLNGGKLMCETRNESRSIREDHRQTSDVPHPPKIQRQISQASTSQASTSQASTSQASTSQASTSQASTSQAYTPRAYTPRASTSQAYTPRARESRPPQLSKSDETEWMIVPRRNTVKSSNYRQSRPQQRQPTVELAQ